MDRVITRLGPGLALALAVGGCFRGNDEIPGEVTMTAGFTTSTSTTSAAETTTTAAETTTTTTTSESTSTGEPADLDAFRVISAKIVDPHCYYQLTPDSCVDITSVLNAGLTSSIDKGSVNIVMVFAPAEPALPEVDFRVIQGKCNDGLDTCAPADGVVVAESIADNLAAGICNVLLPGTHNPDYADDGAPNLPNAPCFLSSRADVAIDLSGSLPSLELASAQVAATYSGADGVDALLKGTLRGYLTQSKGQAVVGDLEGYDFDLWATVAGGAGCQLDPDAPIDDTDPNPDPESAEPGVWIYLNFEAARVEWLE